MSIMLLRISIALVSSTRPTINWSQKIVFICFSEIFFSRIVGLVTTWHQSDQTRSNNVVENIQLLLLRITRSYTNKITELMHSILPAPVRSPGLISVFVKCFPDNNPTIPASQSVISESMSWLSWVHSLSSKPFSIDSSFKAWRWAAISVPFIRLQSPDPQWSSDEMNSNYSVMNLNISQPGWALSVGLSSWQVSVS